MPLSSDDSKQIGRFFSSLRKFSSKIESEAVKAKFEKNIKHYEDRLNSGNLSERSIHSIKQLLREGVHIANTILSSANGRSDLILQILSGGHVVLEDEGALYENFTNRPSAKKRMSSHYIGKKESDKSDLSVKDGLIFREFLIGVFKDSDGRCKTWFQLEATPVHRTHLFESGVEKVINTGLETLTKIATFGKLEANLSTFVHLFDWFKYVAGGKKMNIGQYGKSFYTERSPFVVSAKKGEGDSQRRVSHEAWQSLGCVHKVKVKSRLKGPKKHARRKMKRAR